MKVPGEQRNYISLSIGSRQNLGKNFGMPAGEGRGEKGVFKAKRGKITDSTYGNVITTL
jgi:hypothetical protein